jgi:signal transduction histidine kinase
MLIVPLHISSQTIGTLGISRDRDGHPYSADDQALLKILAERTSQAIHNARLYQELQVSLQNEKETHAQLMQSEKFAAVGPLLASITHEINNPLQTIKNCLYLSQADMPPGTPVYEYLKMATTETDRLSNLVAQLREIYRPPTQGQARKLYLPTLLGEVQALLAGYLHEKHISWEITPSDSALLSSVVVEGVPDQLKQVFLNLSLNAIDAMDSSAGGSLTIDIFLSPDRSEVGIRLCDTGPGLPQEVKDKLFEPFITTKEKGLGLGLMICYDIVKKHNGHIEVESEAGAGATFTVWLPARPA